MKAYVSPKQKMTEEDEEYRAPVCPNILMEGDRGDQKANTEEMFWFSVCSIQQSKNKGIKLHLVSFYLPLVAGLPIIPGSLGGSDGKDFTWNAGDPGLIPGLGRSLGGGHGNPL